jgi:predicted DCC family thiol-disulfide oxidoreductase YuxK
MSAPENNHIVLFDGVCNLCNGMVKFIIKRDKESKFKFASLQSDAGQTLLRKFNLPTDTFHYFIYIKGDTYFIKSSAGLHVLKELGGIWKVFYVFIIVPSFIRDAVYQLISRNRYKLFGRSESCMIPTADVKERFLDT